MKANNKYLKQLTIDNALTYLYWSLGLLAVMSALYIAYLIFIGYSQGTVKMEWAEFIMIAAAPAHLVFGILSAIYVIPDYVRLGVTRRESVIGNITGVLLSTSVFIIMLIAVNWVVGLAVEQMMADYLIEETLFEAVMNFGGEFTADRSRFPFDHSLFTAIVQLIIVFITNVLIFLHQFTAGWLISTGFMRFGFFKGLGTLLIGLFLLMLSPLGNVSTDWLVWFVTPNPLLTWLLYSLISLVVIALGIAVIWAVTRKMPIKPS